MVPDVFLKELDPSGRYDIPTAIAKLRDEVTAISMATTRGHSRSLSFVMAKLDEARMWAIEDGTERGIYAVIPRAEILQKAATNTTNTTVPMETSNGV